MGSRKSGMLTLNPRNAYAWLVLCSLNSALRREKAMGEGGSGARLFCFLERTGKPPEPGPHRLWYR